MRGRFDRWSNTLRQRLSPSHVDAGWMPLWSLAYLGFLAMPVFVPSLGAPDWLQWTLLAALAFLPLYLRSYWAGRRELVLLVVAVWALGIWLASHNFLANTFVVYACAMSVGIRPLRYAVLLAVLLVVAFVLYVAGLYQYGLFSGGITAFVGAASFAGDYLVRENQRKQAALRLSHEEVRRLAATAERERIGRDLHDLLGHTLSLIAIKTELATRVWERDARVARREVEDVEHIARDALAQVRRAVCGIRAAGLASELASARVMLESSAIRFQYDADLRTLPPEVETCLALVVREAATNIQRHSRATRASVRVAHEPGALVVVIADDGRGGDIMPGNGLNGMRERLREIGGALDVDSVRGSGTTLSIRVPLAPDEGAGLRLGVR